MALSKSSGRIAGYSLILMFVLAVFTLMGLDSKIVVENDAAATRDNITTYQFDFWAGIIGYFIILILDVVVALTFYILFQPADRTYASITAFFRLAYTAAALVSLTALAFYHSNVYVNGLLIAYFFFILHLFFLGITVLKAGYVPKFLGFLLVVSAPFYIIIIYGHLFLPADLGELLQSIVMGPAVLAEVLLGLWLILKSTKIPEMADSSRRDIRA